MEAARIEEVVGDFVTLRRRGVNLIGLCPFHNEKTPSFTVSAPKGIFKCFGCGKGGNAVNFLMEHEQYSYPEALRYLAGKYNIEIDEEKPTPEQQQALDEKESLFNLTGFAQKYFEEQLHNSDEGKSVALTYLKERGFTLETIKKFNLGYCSNKWDDFSQTALKNGYKQEYLIKTSLSKTKDKLLYDTFRGRVVFPIHNLSGRVLGFGARIMTGEKNRPKYINSAESEIYHKSKSLYGLYQAKSAIVSQDNCYLVEGYTDVISLYQAGITNVIATSGTALTTDQIKMIRRYTPNVTLLFDGDTAGIKAAFRGIDMILEEALNVRLVLFPEGEDPDSYARNFRPAEVAAFIKDQTRDFISFKTELLLEETKNDPIKKAALIKEIAQTIALVPEAITRSLYLQKCSELMQVEESLMVAEINRLRRQKWRENNKNADFGEEPLKTFSKPQAAAKQDIHKTNNDYQEKELIRLMLQYGDQELEFEVENEDKRIEKIHVALGRFIVDDIQADELKFDNPVCQKIFTTYANNSSEEKQADPKLFTRHEDDEIRSLAIDLLSSQHLLSKNWEKRHKIYVIEEEENLKPRALQAIYAFKLKKLEQMINENQKRIKEISASTPLDEDQLRSLLEANRDYQVKRKMFAFALKRVVTK